MRFTLGCNLAGFQPLGRARQNLRLPMNRQFMDRLHDAQNI